MSHRMLCITALIAIFAWSTLKCDPIITLPYPEDIAKKLKNDNQKNLDLADSEPLTNYTFEEIFTEAKTSKIIVAGVATYDIEGTGRTSKVSDKFVIHYYDALELHKFFMVALKKGGKDEIITKGNYNYLKNNNYTSDIDPFTQERIQAVYFFEIDRSGAEDKYSYTAKYIGNFADIINDASKIADLEIAIINNAMVNTLSKKTKLLEERKLLYGKREKNDPDKFSRFDIAEAIETHIENNLLSPEQKARREQKRKAQQKARQAKLHAAIQEISQSSDIADIFNIFHNQIVPLAHDGPIVKPTEKDFAIIISRLVGLGSTHDAYEFIKQHKSKIEGYYQDPQTITRNVYTDFIKAIETYLQDNSIDKDVKHKFIENLASITDDKEALLETGIRDIVLKYYKTVEDKAKKILEKIKAARSGNEAESIYQQELKPMLTKDTNKFSRKEATQHIMELYIRENNPKAAYDFLIHYNTDLYTYVLKNKILPNFIQAIKKHLATLTVEQKKLFAEKLLNDIYKPTRGRETVTDYGNVPMGRQRTITQSRPKTTISQWTVPRDPRTGRSVTEAYGFGEEFEDIIDEIRNIAEQQFQKVALSY